MSPTADVDHQFLNVLRIVEMERCTSSRSARCIGEMELAVAQMELAEVLAASIVAAIENKTFD